MSNGTKQLAFDDFELDQQLRQLRRGAEVIALPGKAFDLLCYMAENPGRPLSKEELLSAVWPNAFVEEANLSQNVFHLRKALGGSAPILTLPGRGYQFAAAVSEIQQAAPLQATLQTTHTRLVLEETVEERVALRRSPLAWGVLAAGVLLAAAAGWLGWQRWEDHVGGPPVQVVVTSLEGGTGDTVLDQALNTALRAGLSQSPYVTLVSPLTVRSTLGLMTLKPDAELTPSIARDVCERTGSQAVLRGTVAQVGSGFLLTGEAAGCADGAAVATFTETAASREALPQAIDRLATSLRRGLGESRRTIARFSQPLFPGVGRTSSVEALEDWSQATVQSQTGHYAQAIELLKHAVALDPEFAVAWLDLSSYAGASNDRSSMLSFLMKAYAVRAQAIAPVRYTIEARYEGEAQGDLMGAEQSYKAMLALYPRNIPALAALGETERQMGHHADAAATLGLALALQPHYAVLYYGVCTEKMKAGLLDEARQACDSGIAHGMDSEAIRLTLLKLAILKHDSAQRAQQVAWAEQQHSALVLATEAEGELAEGRVRDGLQRLSQACAMLQPKQEGVCNEYRFAVASSLVQMGEMEGAKHLLGGQRPDASDEDGLVLLAQLGDVTAAESGLRMQEAAHPRSPAWEAKVGSVVRASLTLEQHRPEAAVDALEAARAFEWAGLDSFYLRALSYQESGQYAKAEAEFRRMLSHPEVDAVNAELPLAQLGLARCLAAEHRVEEARQVYEGFFAMWVHADPDLSLLTKAHAESLALKAG